MSDTFWFSKFSWEESVSWTSFWNALLSEYPSIPRQTLDLWYYMLVESDRVNKNSLMLLCNYFGRNLATCHIEMSNVLNSPFFHGRFQAERACELLVVHNNKWLVTFSERGYIVFFVDDFGVVFEKHIHISHQQDGTVRYYCDDGEAGETHLSMWTCIEAMGLSGEYLNGRDCGNNMFCSASVTSNNHNLDVSPSAPSLDEVEDLINLDYFFQPKQQSSSSNFPTANENEFERCMREELTCPICLDIFSDPRKLTCDHTFCHMCLLSMFAPQQTSSRNFIRCPECRTNTYFNGTSGVGDLPVDRRAHRMVCSLGDKLELASPQLGTSGGHSKSSEYVHVNRQAVLEDFKGYVPLGISPSDCFKRFEDWKNSIWLTPRDFGMTSSALQLLSVSYVPFYCFRLTTTTSYKATVLVSDPCRTKHNQYCPTSSHNSFTPNFSISTETINNPRPTGDDNLSDDNNNRIYPNPSSLPSTSIGGQAINYNTSQKWIQSVLGIQSNAKLEDGFPLKPIGMLNAKLWEWLDPTKETSSLPVTSEQQQQESKDLHKYRQCEVGGMHSNSYIDVLACAAHSLDPDLLEGLHVSIDDDVEHLHTLSIPWALPNEPASSAPNSTMYNNYVKMVEKLLLNSPYVRQMRNAQCAEDDDVDVEREDGFEGVSWDEVRDALPQLQKPSLEKDAVLYPDVAPQNIWMSRIWEKVKESEVEFTRNLIRQNKAYKIVKDCDINMTLTSLDYRCILIPFYLGRYLYDDKTYDVIVHGRTGQISAKRPWIGGSYLESVCKASMFTKLRSAMKS